MVNMTDDGRNNRTWSRWYVVVGLIFAATFVLTLPTIVQYCQEQALLADIMRGAPRTLQENESSRRHLSKLVPVLIGRHREAFATCRRARGTGVINIRAFNDRIAAWNGLLSAWSFARSPDAEDYIRKHVAAGFAFDDEIENYEQLMRLRERGR